MERSSLEIFPIFGSSHSWDGKSHEQKKGTWYVSMCSIVYSYFEKGHASMRISPSAHSGMTNMPEQVATQAPPVTLSEGSLFMLALVRLFVGLLWFQQLFWKLPPSFAGLHRYVMKEGQYTFLPGYAFIIQHIFLPNFLLLGAFTWTAELVVALSLLFGLFSRFGALLATLLALQLYVGLAYAPGEWYWTYGMLILLGLVLAAIPAGRRLGIDQWLAPHLERAGETSRLARVMRWFV
jgi:thiosulfate dehydrogenase [quinone] large subunit